MNTLIGMLVTAPEPLRGQLRDLSTVERSEGMLSE